MRCLCIGVKALMKKFTWYHRAWAAAGSVALALSLAACGGGGGNNVVLSAAEIDGLVFMREEEKLAHDVYVYLYGLWPVESIFLTISVSETSHTEAILTLLQKYGIPDPAAGKLPGEYTDTDLQALYNTLVVMGQTNEIEALKVGGLIEETDIRDINAKKRVTTVEQILSVYDRLLCGSRNHLRGFDARLDALAVSYVPSVLTQAEWDAIANTPMETCSI